MTVTNTIGVNARLGVWLRLDRSLNFSNPHRGEPLGLPIWAVLKPIRGHGNIEPKQMYFIYVGDGFFVKISSGMRLGDSAVMSAPMMRAEVEKEEGQEYLYFAFVAMMPFKEQ